MLLNKIFLFLQNYNTQCSVSIAVDVLHMYNGTQSSLLCAVSGTYYCLPKYSHKKLILKNDVIAMVVHLDVKKCNLNVVRNGSLDLNFQDCHLI